MWKLKMSCCKRYSGGLCNHDLELEREKRKLIIAQLTYDLGRPGNTMYDIQRIQKEIDALPLIPDDPSKCHLCPACKKILPNELTHQYRRDVCGFEETYYDCSYVRKNSDK